jgi:hypothetical protein
MSGRISPLAVVKTAVSIGWRRKWTFFGLALAGLLPILLLSGLPALAPSWRGPFLIPSSFVQFLAMLFLVTTANHLAVTMQEGEGTVFPVPFWAAMGRVFVRGLILMLIPLGLLLLVVGPLAVLGYQLLLEGAEILPPFLEVLILAAGAGMYVLFVCFMFRFGIMIPGAAVGHVIGVREALVLTRGHAWRMFWSMVMIVVPVMALSALVEALVSAASLAGGFGWVQAVPLLLLLFVDLFSWIVLLALNAVWYRELLDLRATPGGRTFDFEPAPRPVSYVGPYADLGKRGK